MSGPQLWLNGSSRPSWSSAIGATSSLPMRSLLLPDGMPCWEANLYLASLLRRGRSHASVRTYASDISSIVRFCFETNTSFASLDDQRCIDFMAWLKTQKRPAISNSHANRLLNRTLDFLRWLERYNPNSRPLIGDESVGAQVTVERKRVRGAARRGAQDTHVARLPPSAPVIVRPMPRAAMDQLRLAVNSVYKGRYARARAHALLTFIADTGCRRVEAVWANVDDINSLSIDGDMQYRLRLRSAKRAGHPERMVPLPRTSAAALSDFVNVDRAIYMARKKYRSKALFVTRDGQRLHPDTVTQMFAQLRHHARITSRACAHMFRHRWITLQLAERLSGHRKSELGVEFIMTVLTRLASLSGHRDPNSLWTYVDFAFEDIVRSPRAEARISARMELEALQDAMQVLLADVAERGTLPGQLEMLKRAASQLIDIYREMPTELRVKDLSTHSTWGRREL